MERKEAIQIIKNNWPSDRHMLSEALKFLIPELKESEDERMIKFIKQQLLKIKKAITENYELDAKLTRAIDWLEKQGKQKPTLPIWKYKNDNTPLSRDSLILNKYGCVAKSPAGALVSDVWVIDYNELAKLPKEEIEKQGNHELQSESTLETTKEENVDNRNYIKPADNVEPKFHEGEWITIKE